jgi:nascent polypeptide-associated complex subunit alpha
MYQIVGGEISEAKPQPSAPVTPPEADVQLVAQQTGKSLEESEKALTEAGGDLARAILLLKGQTNRS